MGMIRGGLFSLVLTVLFVSIFLANSLAVVHKSLDYDLVKPQLETTVKDMIDSETDLNGLINENYLMMELFCLNNTAYVQNYGAFTFEVPCTVVDSGPDAVYTYLTEDLLEQTIEESYYKEYDCSLLKCSIEESPFVLVSQHARSYWRDKFYLALVVAIVSAIAAFFLIESKSNFPFALGVPLVVAALPFAKTEWLFSFLTDVPFIEFVRIFLAESSSVFMFSFVFGLVLIGAGIVLKFVDVGNFFQGIFDKFKKKDSSEKK